MSILVRGPAISAQATHDCYWVPLSQDDSAYGVAHVAQKQLIALTWTYLFSFTSQGLKSLTDALKLSVESVPKVCLRPTELILALRSVSIWACQLLCNNTGLSHSSDCQKSSGQARQPQGTDLTKSSGQVV